MPLPFSLPPRPSLPSLSWALGSSNTTSSETQADEQTPKSAPPRTSHSSTSSHFRRLSASRSIKHTSILVSRPTTPANPSPLSSGFGLPTNEDDDPFGVLALQKAGLHIKEAGTNYRPGSEAFQYRPAPSSPIWRSSMASAMSRASRPSMDGRSSVMTGRSFVHSRQGSTGTFDVSNQATDTDATDRASVQGKSPVGELVGGIRKTSPDSKGKRSPDSVGRVVSRPDPLPLSSSDQKRRDETPSPRTKLAVVDEDAQEDMKKEELNVTIESEYASEEPESDLDRLARELREMADEHEEERSRSRGKNARTPSSVGEREKESSTCHEEDSDGAHTPQRLSKGTSREAIDTSDELAAPTTSIRHSVEVLKHASGQNEALGGAQETEDADQGEDDEDEFSEDDDDEYDFDDDEEPVIIEAAMHSPLPANLRPRNMAMASLQARAQIVSVHLPPPPKIPSKNPRRPRQSDDNESTALDALGEEFTYRSPSLSQDNDSTSSYSRDRDSFDDGQDTMTQTSQGSEEASPGSTPTREKRLMSFPDKSEHPLKEEQLPSQESHKEPAETRIGFESSSLQPHLPSEDDREVLPSISIVEDDVHADSQHIDVQEAKPDLLATSAPEVPQRRRPFSFEPATNEDTSLPQAMDKTTTEEEQISFESKTHPQAAEAIKADEKPTSSQKLASLNAKIADDEEEDFS